jgi:hypothetical protein
MSCCNKAPNGGSNNLALMFKVLVVMLVAILVLVVLFG